MSIVDVLFLGLAVAGMVAGLYAFAYDRGRQVGWRDGWETHRVFGHLREDKP